MKNLFLTFLAFSLSTCALASIGPITGYTIMCLNTPCRFSDTTAGGTWSSSDTLIAQVDAFGNVTGMAVGTAIITYSVSTSYVTQPIVVKANPSPISGPSVMCVGASATFTDTTAGGGWWDISGGLITIISSTSNSLLIGARGPWNPYANTITFTDTGGCTTTTNVFVNPPPGPITGRSILFLDSTTTLIDRTPTYGSWSSSNTSVATIDPVTGVVTGVSLGVTTISYFYVCASTMTLTVMLPSDVPGLSLNRGVTLYPNPASNELIVSCSEKLTELIISNRLGQVVYRNKYEDNKVHINIADLAAGVYLVRINGTEVRRFVKQ